MLITTALNSTRSGFHLLPLRCCSLNTHCDSPATEIRNTRFPMSRGRSSEKSSTAITSRSMNCAWRKISRQPILRCSANWKASTGRPWEGGIGNSSLLFHQRIRLPSCLSRAHCSEAVQSRNWAPSDSFDRISVWGYKPFNDAAGRPAQVSPPPQEARNGYV